MRYAIPVLISLTVAAVGQSPPRTNPPGEVHFAEMTRPLPFLLLAPAEHDPSKPAPLLVALHGRGGTCEAFAALWRGFDHPAFLMAVPEAPYPLGQQSPENRNFSWDYPSENRTLWDRADPQIPVYIHNIIQEVRKFHKVGPIFVLGFSQGAAYATFTGLEYPDEIRGVLAVGGINPEPFMRPGQLGKGRGQVAFFLAQGTQDQQVKASEGPATRALLEKAGFPVSWYSYEGGHTFTPALLREIQSWISHLCR